MKAVALTRYLPVDEPDSLLDVQLPDPAPGPRDLLVEIRAIAVNPVDCKVRAPKAGEEKSPRVLGWDAAGVVTKTGREVQSFGVGDEVYYAGSIARPGCNSELHVVDERIVARKPRTLDFAHAAALPLTSLTAWEGLFDRLRISREKRESGRTVLVFAGAGGVGSIAIQMAARLAGLRVIATASRPESTAWATRMGAHHVIDHTKPLAAQLAALGLEHVDHVLALRDTDQALPLLPGIVAPQGSILLVNSATRPHDLQPFMQKSVTIAWELMFTRSLFGTGDMAEQGRILESVAQLVDDGILQSTMATNLGRIDAANLRTAHRMLESGRTIGKIVLEGFAA